VHDADQGNKSLIPNSKKPSQIQSYAKNSLSNNCSLQPTNRLWKTEARVFSFFEKAFQFEWGSLGKYPQRDSTKLSFGCSLARSKEAFKVELDCLNRPYLD